MSKIVFFGTPDYVLPIPQALLDNGDTIAAVITQPPKPVGRKQILTPSPVEEWATKNNILIFHNLEQLEKNMVDLGAEVGIVASYGQVIPLKIINSFPQGILNIHPSRLPKYRGASPIQAAILAGDTQTAVTIIKMDEKMDHGPIISQEVLEISDNETFASLRTRAFEAAAQRLVKVLPDYLDGKITPQEQNHKQATYTWLMKETKQKAYFDIDDPPSPKQLKRMVRAFYPWPIAWTKWSFGNAEDKQKRVIKFFPERKIQIEGKNPVRFEEFKRVYPDFPLTL